MTDEQKDSLTTIIKNKCYITDTSDLITNRLEALVDEAIVKIEHYLGTSNFDFSTASLERELLVNYVFYMWNDKTMLEFENAYISDIMKLRALYETDTSDEDDDTTDEEDTSDE